MRMAKDPEALVKIMQDCKDLACEIDRILGEFFGDFHLNYLHPKTIGKDTTGRFRLLKTPDNEAQQFYVSYEDTIIYSYGALGREQIFYAQKICEFLNYKPLRAGYFYFHPMNDVIELLLTSSSS